MREAIAMRRRDREVVDVAEKEAILGRVTCGHLAMLHDGKPYGVTLNFGWERDSAGSYVLWFHCAGEGRKIDALTANRNVWFFAEREGEFQEKLETGGVHLGFVLFQEEALAVEGQALRTGGVPRLGQGLQVAGVPLEVDPEEGEPPGVRGHGAMATPLPQNQVVPRIQGKRPLLLEEFQVTAKQEDELMGIDDPFRMASPAPGNEASAVQGLEGMGGEMA